MASHKDGKKAAKGSGRKKTKLAAGKSGKPRKGKAVSSAGEAKRGSADRGRVQRPETREKRQAGAKQGLHQAKSNSPCSVDARCGGCKNLAVPYKLQLVRKQVAIERLFDGIADERTFSVIKGMKDPYHYRNKVISPFAPGKKLSPAPAKDAKGKAASKGKHLPARYEILTGMYAAGTHDLVPTDRCLIENEVAKKVTLAVRDIMRKHGISAYRESTGTGFMRHAVVRVGHASGEVLVTLVTNSDEFPSSKSFCRELIHRCPQVTTVVQNVNERQTNVILGDKERVLYGPGFILDELCGLSFRISSKSFYQVNAAQTEVLYRCAMDLARFDGTQTAIDAYCGTGTIGLVAAKSGAARVIGVDSVEAAIRDAQQNARHNGVDNAEFVAADATAFMEDLARDGLPEDAGDLVILMDPPRAGSTERFLRAAASLKPARIVYVSCNPETQERDVELLYDLGYRVVAVQPVDMFPHTDHIECIVALEPADSPAAKRLAADEDEEDDGAAGAAGVEVEDAEGEDVDALELTDDDASPDEGLSR